MQRRDRERLAEARATTATSPRSRGRCCRPCWRPAAPAWRCAAASGPPPRRRRSTPTMVSTTKITTSAVCTAISAWAAMAAARSLASGLPAAGVHHGEPPAGPLRRRRRTRSRVTPGMSSTTACRRPMIRLTSVDLPTLGRPTTATTVRVRAGAVRCVLGFVAVEPSKSSGSNSTQSSTSDTVTALPPRACSAERRDHLVDGQPGRVELGGAVEALTGGGGPSRVERVAAGRSRLRVAANVGGGHGATGGVLGAAAAGAFVRRRGQVDLQVGVAARPPTRCRGPRRRSGRRRR